MERKHEVKEAHAVGGAELLKTLTNPEIFTSGKKIRGRAGKARMDRIYTDQIIRPKPTCETRKGKNETNGIALWN